MRVIYVFLICCLAFSCEERDCGCVPPPPCSGCGLRAVIKDFSGLDGCSIGLELKDGTKLFPERRVYVKAPEPADDPAYYFKFVPGDTVCIEYKKTNLVTACMAGETVFLNCIKKVPTGSE